MTLTNLTTTLISGADHTIVRNDSNGTRLPSPEPVAKLDLNLFEEIKDYLDRCVRYERDEKEDRSKVEKLNLIIDQAEEISIKATEKKEALLKRHLMLKATLYEHEQKIKKSLDYWADFGLDIQATDDGYKFIYTKLATDQPICVDLRPDVNGGKLELVSQEPEILTNDQLTNFNTVRLIKYCKNNLIDFRGAMLEIKKELVRNLAATSKKADAGLEHSSNPEPIPVPESAIHPEPDHEALRKPATTNPQDEHA